MPNSGKVKDTGFRSYEKGDKVYYRHHNYEIVFNPADPYGDAEEFEDFEFGNECIRFLRSFIHNVDEEEAEETLETTMRLKIINYNAKRDYPLYYQMPVTFNKISSYLRGTEKLDKLEEKREELLRKLEELDMDMAHIRGCLKDIF